MLRRLIKISSFFVILLALFLLLGACGGGGSGGQGGGNKETYDIYLSNNFLGNDYRVQMTKTAEAALKHPPLEGRAKLEIVNAETTVPAQIASLNQIVQRTPDAILIDAGSPDALNPTIERACDQNIVVVSFDQTVTAECAYKVHTDFQASAQSGAEWLVETLDGGGNVLVDQGLPGAPISQTILDGFDEVLQKNPDVKVTGKYTGEYALGPEQQGVASLLASSQKVDGVLTQGYCTGAMEALKGAGRDRVPMYCQAYNGTLTACDKEGQDCFLTSNPAWLSAEAMKLAVAILDGDEPENKDIVVESPCFTTNEVTPKGLECDKVKVGTNAFPDLAPGLTLPVSPKWTKIQPSEVD